jgi:hypothetical protein
LVCFVKGVDGDCLDDDCLDDDGLDGDGLDGDGLDDDGLLLDDDGLENMRLRRRASRTLLFHYAI